MANKIIRDYHYLIVSKSRQTGITTDLGGVCLYGMNFHDNWGSAIMSRTGKVAQDFIGKIKFAMTQLSLKHPFLMQEVQKANEKTVLLANFSVVEASTTTADGIRSTTACFFIVDEAAFARQIAEGFSSSLHTLNLVLASYMDDLKKGKKTLRPWGIAVVSSPNGKTGKGYWFWNMWDKSKHPHSKYPEEEQNAYIPLRYHWSEVPEYDDAWYSQECKNLNFDIARIRQELDLVFLDSVSNLIPARLVSAIKVSNKPIKKYFADNFHIYMPPSPTKQYLIGADCATGETINDDPDESAFVVLDVDTGIIQADFSAYVRYDTFAKILYKAGVLYNNALVAVERNHVGISVIQKLRDDLQYQNMYIHKGDGLDESGKVIYGYPTVGTNRNRIVNVAIASLYENPYLNSIRLLNQYLGLENRKGKIAGYGSNHDDIVMAHAISIEIRRLSYGYTIGDDSLMSVDKEYSDTLTIKGEVDLIKSVNEKNMTEKERVLSKQEESFDDRFFQKVEEIEEKIGESFSYDEIDSILRKFKGRNFTSFGKSIRK